MRVFLYLLKVKYPKNFSKIFKIKVCLFNSFSYMKIFNFDLGEPQALDVRIPIR